MEKTFTEKAKATATKTWEYVKQYRDLKQQLLSSWVVPLIKQKIEIIYPLGLIVLGVFALIALFEFPNIPALLFGLVSVLLSFIVFRTLCEIVAVCPTGDKKAAPVAATAVKVEKKQVAEKPAKKPAKKAKRKAKKAKKAKKA